MQAVLVLVRVLVRVWLADTGTNTGLLAGGAGAFATPLEGRSLMPHLRGSPGGHDEALGEYYAEGVCGPM